jgi:hypothetical protein
MVGEGAGAEAGQKWTGSATLRQKCSDFLEFRYGTQDCLRACRERRSTTLSTPALACTVLYGLTCPKHMVSLIS